MTITDYFPHHVFQYCPVCGAKKFQKSSEKSLKCQACGFQYFVNPAAAVAAIITDSNNHILFTKRAQEPFKNTWDLPGGFVDPNETAEEAVDREVKEELSIHIQSKSYYRSYWNHYFYGGVTYYTLDMAFLCQVNNFQNLKTSDEIRAYQFVPKNKVDLNKIGLPSIRRTVADYLLSNH